VTARKTAKTRQADGTLVLTSDEAVLIRRALADCHDVIDRAGSAGPVVLAALQAAALDAPEVRRPLNQVQGDASLAIDHIDFPRLRRNP
jgi:hypothetical protein